MRACCILIVFLLNTIIAGAQTELNEYKVDSLSYDYYINGEWHALLLLAKQAKQQHITSYWLNLRAAFAAQVLNKPFVSLHYYEQNLKQFPNDPITLPLAYQTQLQIGQYSQGLRLHAKLAKDSTLAQLYPKRPPIHLAHVEYGIKQCTDDSLYKPMHYTQFGFGFRVKSIAFYNALSYLNQSTYFGNTQQYQYYLSASIPFPLGITATPVYHFVSYQIEATNFAIPDSVKQGRPHVVGGAISMLVKNMVVGVGFYHSNMNFTFQNQIQPSITWYPFNNTRLSIAALGNYLLESKKMSGSLLFNCEAVRKVNLSGGYLLANVRYFTEQNGYLVNNSFDITNNRWLISLMYNITPKLSIYGVYLHEKRTLPIAERPYQNNMGVLGFKTLF